jgi:hypothetical protein
VALKPEDIALLIAIGEHTPSGEAHEFSDTNAPTGNVIRVGSLQFPPDINNPGASLVEQEKWITSLHSLRTQYFLTLEETNVYHIHGVGRQLLDRIRRCGRKTSAGKLVWEAIKEILQNLQRAQQAQTNNPSEESNRKEISRLTQELLSLCRELQTAI